MKTEDMLLIGVLIIVGIVVMKFVYWTVGRDFRKWARYQQDPEFRQQEIVRLNGVLEQDPQDAASWLLRAQLWHMSGEHAKALEDTRKYLTLKSNDSEGWAELCECALSLNEADVAVEAADKAIELDSTYIDYHALRLRAALLANDLERASKELAEWKELDSKRVAAGDQSKSIFKSDVRHFGDLVSDPALIAYEAAIADRQGDNVAAHRLVEKMQQEHADVWSVLRENDPLLAKLDM